MNEQRYLGGICWWGTNYDGDTACVRETPDDFCVTYYGDFCGKPWRVLGGPFCQSDGSLVVSGPVRTGRVIAGIAPEHQYYGQHGGLVSVEVGESVWMEISNAPSGICSWYWETLGSADPISLQTPNAISTTPGAEFMKADLAFQFYSCGDEPIDRSYSPQCGPSPDNDACGLAEPLPRNQIVPFNTKAANTDGAPLLTGYGTGEISFPLGDQQVHHDVWYLINLGVCEGTIAIDICNADFDTKVAVYYPDDNFWDDCDTWNTPFLLSDDACGPEPAFQSRITTFVQRSVYIYEDFFWLAANQFLLRLGGYRGGFGTGEISWDFVAPESSDLRVFAAFANCRGAVCATSTCNPPLYRNSCCLAQDFDADGDVDLLDYQPVANTLVGP
jgi:hypothetical protein